MSFYLSAQEVIDLIQGRVVNLDEVKDALSSIQVTRLTPLGKSSKSDLAFFFSKDYQTELVTATPTILITGEPFVEPLRQSGLSLWKDSVIIACRDPYWAMAFLSGKFAEHLSSVAHISSSDSRRTKIHPTAVISQSARIGDGAQVGAHCVIEEGVEIGENTVLYPNCFVGPNAKIGHSCVLFPSVTLYEYTEVGNRVRIHSGAVIGADGFGYDPVLQGQSVTHHEKIYHLGKVVIGDDVEIGANSSIDRATLGETVVGPKVKIDNQVQIAHNCILEEGAIVCGSAGMAGGARLGKYAYIGGQSAVSNRVYVKAGAKVAGMTGVTKDVPEGSMVAGNPQREFQKHFQIHAMLNRMLSQRKSK